MFKKMTMSIFSPLTSGSHRQRTKSGRHPSRYSLFTPYKQISNGLCIALKRSKSEQNQADTPSICSLFTPYKQVSNCLCIALRRSKSSALPSAISVKASSGAHHESGRGKILASLPTLLPSRVTNNGWAQSTEPEALFKLCRTQHRFFWSEVSRQLQIEGPIDMQCFPICCPLKLTKGLGSINSARKIA